MSAVKKPFFLTGSFGDIFCSFIMPSDNKAVTRAVVFFPPFAEEMNKSRRMVTLQAERLANLGLACLIVDLYGTGDSQGDFGEASWEIWLDNMQTALHWLVAQGITRVTYWGLRLGALLALQSVNSTTLAVEKIVLWQPVSRGDTVMTQFLRLRLAADLMTNGQKITPKDLRDTLTAGHAVEVAGYTLAPALVTAIDGLDITPLAQPGMPDIEWIELLPSEQRPMGAVSRKVIDSWQQSGMNVRTHCVIGESFWVTPEITTVPNLLTITSDLIA